jgi:hypothetical protein
MTSSKIYWKLSDGGGRRLGIDRRSFSYSYHIPERRRGEDRRSYTDSQSGLDIKLIELQLIGVPDEKEEDIDRRSIWN